MEKNNSRLSEAEKQVLCGRFHFEMEFLEQKVRWRCPGNKGLITEDPEDFFVQRVFRDNNYSGKAHMSTVNIYEAIIFATT